MTLTETLEVADKKERKCKDCGVGIYKKSHIARSRCLSCCALLRKRYEKKSPWSRFLYGARSRCRGIGNSSYYRYGGRGIECLLSMDDVRSLWIRDGASKMKHPSIDRINPNGNYQFGNCRFIEVAMNSSLACRKLRLDQVIEIKKLKASGLSASKIGRMFGVAKSTIFDISWGKRWALALAEKALAGGE